MTATTRTTAPVARRFLTGCALIAASVVGSCGGDDGPAVSGSTAPPPAPTSAPPAVPAVATTAIAKLQTDSGRSVTRLGALEAGALFAVNPGLPLSPNVTGAADTSAGAPPNSFTFRGTYDGNGNGQDETTLDGSIVFVNDPTDFNAGFNGAQGRAVVDINILGLMHVYHGDLSFSLGMASHRLTAGGGTFTDPLSGTTTTLAIDRNEPLAIKLADGSANAKANACAHSLEGPAQLTVTGSAGTLVNVFTFSHASATTRVTGSFTDTAGATVVLPETQVDLGCAGNNDINAWNGRYRIRWACLPRESGEFNTTIAVKNATALTMIDDGDTAADAYEAALVGASARAVRGFFIDGPAGSRYREDFNWTLNLDGSGFSQSSRYVYFEGANAGKGGMCVARATRLA